MTQTLPMRGDYLLSFTIQGRPQPGRTKALRQLSRRQPRVFPDDGDSAAAGTALTRSDSEKAPMVARVDEVRRPSLSNENPIGRASTSATAPTASTKSSASSATCATQPRRLDRADDVRAVRSGSVQRHVGARRARGRARARCPRAVRQTVQRASTRRSRRSR